MIDVESPSGIRCFYSSNEGEKSDFSGCAALYKRMAESLKIKKYCKSDALASGCVPKYQSYSVDKNCIGYSEQMINKYNQVFELNNGSLMIVYNHGENNPMPVFAVDVNGKRPPNKAGKDLFSFVVIKGKNGSYHFHSNIGFCLPVESDGITSLYDILEK